MGCRKQKPTHINLSKKINTNKQEKGVFSFRIQAFCRTQGLAMYWDHRRAGLRSDMHTGPDQSPLTPLLSLLLSGVSLSFSLCSLALTVSP